MLPSHAEQSWYRFVIRRLAHAVSAIVARCSSVLQQASDESPSFR
jgi:hypothetical protein